MNFVPPISFEKTQAWYDVIKDSQKRFDCVFVNDENEILAFGGLTNIDYSIRKAEFYVFVNPSKQKQGIGTKATGLLCKYGFEVLQLHKVYLYTNATNVGAQKTYEKVGFKLEGVHRQEKIKNESYEDRLYYGLLSNELRNEELSLNFFGGGKIVVYQSVIQFDGFKLNVVRDDLFPEIGGGNKGRKALFYEQYMKDNGFNAMVTTGGIQSNHNRAIALMAARNRWKCHLVYHGTRERFEQEKGNALLVRLAGAETEFVEASQIGPSMDKAMNNLKARGYNPFYITGGGHDLPGGIAFVEAVKSLKEECDKIGYKPDYIFHASGTGSTQAGIAVGLDLIGWSDVKLIGISVARQYDRGKAVVEEFANRLAKHYGLEKDYIGHIDFRTDYLCGGYENYTPEMKSYLERAMSETGLIFDTTYSGKAFFGMMDMIKKNALNGNFLFWHTGGIMNVMK